MKTRLLFALTSTTVLLASAHDALAGGIALDQQSARGTGMASAVTGFIDDAAGIYYNPAGIARGKGLDLQAGVTLVSLSVDYTSPAGKKTSTPFDVITPFQVYGTYGITDWLTAGLGVFVPYGARLEWPAGWEGRRQITKISLRPYYFNPTVAAKFGPVRFGAGLQVVRSSVELQRDVSFGAQDGSTDVGGAGWGVGANAGLQVEAIKQYLNVGLTYRSAVKIDYEGDGHFSNVPRELQGLAHDQKVATSVTNPDQLAFALATHPIKDLVIDAEVVWLGWGKFRSVDIRFPDDATGTLSTKQPKNWSNAVNYRLGAEGTVHKNWRIRGGFMYDPTPQPANTMTPDIPDADRLNFAVGGSYVHESGLHVDLGYQFIQLLKFHSTAPTFVGDYGGNASVLGISIGYTQPKKAEPAPEPVPEPAPATMPATTPETPPATTTTPGG